MRRLAFITNFSKTKFYAELARILQNQYAAEIFWISTASYWTNYLVEHGVETTRILDLQNGLSCVDMKDKNGPVKSLPINKLLMLDRGWKKNPNLTTENLRKSYRLISSFLVQHNIEVIVGEITWAVELLSQYIAKEQGRLFVLPHTMRVPSDRFLFFTELESSFLNFRKNSEFSLEDVRSLANSIINNGLKPFYFTINNKVPGNVSMSKLKLFKAYLSHIPLVRYSGLMDITAIELLRLHVKKTINYYRVKNIFNAIPTKVSKKSFVLFALQLQPESSVEVLGETLTEQRELIRWLAASLPDGLELWVKEHSNALGVRSLNYYNKIIALPNVKLIDPFVPSVSLIGNALAVASVSSTICLEAALIGTPALVFSKPYFHRMGMVHVCRSPEDVVHVMKNLGTSSDFTEPDLAFMENALNASYEGIIAGPLDYPGVLHPNNLNKVASGFNDLLTAV